MKLTLPPVLLMIMMIIDNKDNNLRARVKLTLPPVLLMITMTTKMIKMIMRMIILGPALS